jgi:hypothetical protein
MVCGFLPKSRYEASQFPFSTPAEAFIWEIWFSWHEVDSRWNYRSWNNFFAIQRRKYES